MSGPSITLQCGFKCLYSDANQAAVSQTVADYLGVEAADLRKPLVRPRIIIGFDVETTDWDDQTSFARQDEHFESGFPCHADHKSGAGHVCAIGYSVFQRTQNESNIYIADEPVSLVIKLPEGQTISKKAFDVHGITDDACQKGQACRSLVDTGC